MPTAINATIGSASANSYTTENEAQTYLGNRLNSTAWDNANSEDRAKALLMATKRLERENWIGSRVDNTQSLSWPRYGAEKPDAIGGYGNLGYPYGQEQFLTTEIPQLVKDAQCELALSYLAGYGQTGGSTIKSFSADGFSVSYGETRSETSLPESAMRLIASLVRGAQLERA